MDREPPFNLPPRHPPVPPALRAEAFSRLRTLLIRTLTQRLPELFEQMDEALFNASNQPDTQQYQFDYFHAMGVIRKAKRDVLSALIDGFKSRYDAFVMVGVADELADQSVELEVLEERVLEEMIALDNMVSKVVDGSQPVLGYLSTRVEYLVGHSVALGDNPFAPEHLCEVFLDQLNLLSVGVQPREKSQTVFTRWLVTLWPKLVVDCNNLLVELGVMPGLEQQRRPGQKKATPLQERQAQPEIATAATNKEEASRKAAPAESGAIPPKGAFTHRIPGEGDYGEILSDVHRWLRAQVEAGSNAPPKPEGFKPVTSTDVLQAIHHMRQQADDGATEALLQTLATRGLEQVIGDLLAEQNRSVDDLDSLSQMVVRLMDQSFGRLTSQQLSPQALKGMLLRMELPMACMAMKDVSFFERPAHPARRLMDELCRASSSFLDDESADTDPLRKKVDEVIGRFEQIQLSIKELTSLLTDFIDFVEKDRRQQAMREDRVLEEAQASARVSEAHTQVASAMLERFGTQPWPASLLVFCEKAWCKVLFLAVLRHGADSEPWQLGLQSLDRLMMMATAGQTPAYNQWEQLKAALREQLDNIGYDLQLADRQLEAVRLALRDQRNTAEIENARAFNAHGLDLPGEALVSDNPMEDDDIVALGQVDALKRGAWLEFIEPDRTSPRRCKLAGVIKGNGKYIFTNRKGVKVIEQNRYQLAHRFREGSVKVLDNARLFDGVYEGLIQDIRSQLHQQSGAIH